MEGILSDHRLATVYASNFAAFSTPSICGDIVFWESFLGDGVQSFMSST
jgi:hypothetical protein